MKLAILFGEEYDLTTFSHPGGDESIKYIYHIPDATPYYMSYHREDKSFLQTHLAKYKTGITKIELYDYEKYNLLKTLVYSHILSRKLNTYYRTNDILLLLAIATAIICLLTTNWFIFHFFAGLLNVGFSIGLLHSAGHMSIHKRFNTTLYKIGAITSGLIPLDAWRLNHNYFHHIFTGDELDADRDNYQSHLQTHPLSKYPKHKYSTIKKCAYIFALFIFPGQWFGLIRQHYKWIVLGGGIRGFIGILNKSKYMDVISILTIILFGSYVLIKPVSCCISFFIGMNITFTCIVLPNHASNDTYNSIQTNTNCWATKQITESANYSMDNYVITHIFGGINFQIEHHLFPKLPPHLLVEIQPIVMKFCKENNIKYNSFSNVMFGIISGIQNIFIHN